ncbi:sigma-54 interaction domain-containing protein [Psychrobacillus sp. NPDC096426]|uniref:sigma-54 interaction domain-containing protein n=1 Tax=Psychrobacillus sp. NPDC096426 TaxID=3364491 RepID=UPI0038115D79
MEATKVNNNLLNFGYFKIDSFGIVSYLSSDLCKRFGLSKNEKIGVPVENLLTSRAFREKLGKIENENKVVFGVIGEVACLISISPSYEENRSEYTCSVILLKEDIEANDVLDFWKSMNPEENNKKKKNPQNNYSHKYSFDQLIGSSPAMNEVIELASKVAKSRSTVLITGESGTGKELFAQSTHDLSSRRTGPFVAINCTAIPEHLFESELFGYEGGSFSGAKREGKPGKVELAQNGTLFLDEISELPLLVQGKILRVLQEREVERIGATGWKFVDIRIIAATNKNLETLVNEGKFRQDLYYRLKVFELNVPPLRKRKEDILTLTWHFIERFNNELGLDVKNIDPSLKQWLLNYQWPGNVRELQAAIERGMNIVEGNTLYLDNVGLHSDLYSVEDSVDEEFLPMEEEVAKAEISAIHRALKKTNGDRMAAAHILKIHIASLYRKLNKYNLK